MQNTVVIDCFPESAPLYARDHAIVAIDVIRATTTAVTAVATGRRCFPVPSVEAAWRLKSTLTNPLMVGEVAGAMPEGFHMNNSPSGLALRTDFQRPAILLSSSGTKLVHAAKQSEAVYLACFRNYSAVSAHLTGRHPRIALIGAGSGKDFREEDQMCCAWIAAGLIAAGYVPENENTQEIVERWNGSTPEACATGKSADYLRRSGQTRDLDFILSKIDDLDDSFMLQNDEIVMIPADNGYSGVVPSRASETELSDLP